MSGVKRTQASTLAPIDIRNQVNAIHNSNFPFSSPAIDDHSSLKSIRTGNTALSHNPFESPNSSTTTLTEYDSGATSDQDTWHLERYSEGSKVYHNKSSRSDTKPFDRSPGLQIVTDFPKPIYHANDIVIDQVQARQAQMRLNHARSVVSQKGIEVRLVKSNSKSGGGAGVKKQKRQALLLPSGNASPARVNRSESQKSIVIGLCIPQDEANALRQHEGAATLNTPNTPAIILTPPDERLMPSSKNARPRPASSVYSTITCSREYRHEDEEVPPLPALPPHIKTTNIIIPPLSRTKADSPAVADQDRYIIQTTPDGCDTPRSQGWWNLLLSPMLSRHNSFANKMFDGKDTSPPPVPGLPEKFEKNAVAATPNTNISPDTPRRLGLAGTPSGSWSTWTEWEQQAHIRSYDAELKTPSTAFPGKTFPLKEPCADMKEGLAAEYYHACAIEQLTGANYFECINHSCQEQLPRLGACGVSPIEGEQAAKDLTNGRRQSKKLLVLGSPFKDGKIGYPLLNMGSKEVTDDEDESITDIDSDDEIEKTSREHKEILTPTDSVDEPDELSPNVRKANTAAFIKAKARGITETTRSTPKVQPTPQPTEIPNIAAFVARKSPPPVVAETKRTSTEKPIPAIPLCSGQSTPVALGLPRQRSNQHQLLSQQFFMNPKGGFSGLPATPAAIPAFTAPPQRTGTPGSISGSSTFTTEKTLATARNGPVETKKRKCLSVKDLFKRKAPRTKSEKKRRRCCALCICIILLLIVILCIVLATTITRKGDGTPVASRWLNLTGYPPMPIGISTIAQPELAQSQSGCVQPPTLWSCALPKDDQARVTSNGSSIPDFRFEIRYRNGTTPANMNIPLTRRANDPFTNDLFTANPVPPNDADQLFLGNTTDNITAPFNGEATPFYITFMSTFPVVPSAFNISSRGLTTRQANLGINIPAPNTLSDGSAVPASLLPTDPFPTSQPVRLYNRGHDDEHYGFYVYYDKSIFLSGIKISGGNTSTTDAADTNADEDGGATKDTANIQCTWQQTRFLVKIYTNAKFDGSIFTGRQNVTLDTSKESEYSSATDFLRPGSFPYPTSVVLDRHGGNINNKITYCYGVDKGKIVEDEKVLVFEDRAAGGVLINGAPSFVDSKKSDDSFDSSAGGIDGGTGGCSCTWQNWK